MDSKREEEILREGIKDGTHGLSTEFAIIEVDGLHGMVGACFKSSGESETRALIELVFGKIEDGDLMEGTGHAKASTNGRSIRNANTDEFDAFEAAIAGEAATERFHGGIASERGIVGRWRSSSAMVVVMMVVVMMMMMMVLRGR